MNNPGSGALLALLPGLFCGFPMLMIVIGALLPRYFARARQILATRPWRSFGLGLVNLFFFFALGALFSQSALDLLRLVAGLCVFVALPVIVVLGWATAAGLAGERILALVTERPTSPLVVLVIGLACLGVVALLPIIGWLALIVLVMAGFGAALLALFYPAESARGRPQDGLPSAAQGDPEA